MKIVISILLIILVSSIGHAETDMLVKLSTYKAPVSRDKEVYDMYRERSEPVPLKSTDVLAVDMYTIASQNGYLPESNQLTESVIKTILNDVYLIKTPGSIVGWKPWTHWNFIKSLSNKERELLIKQLSAYISKNGVMDVKEYGAINLTQDKPKPFGLVIGSSNIADVTKTLERYNGKLTLNEKMKSKNVVNEKVDKYVYTSLNLDDNIEALFWFYEGILSAIDYKMKGDINYNVDKLVTKYGNQHGKEYTGGYVWHFGDTKLTVNNTFYDGVIISYISNTMISKIGKSNDDAYNNAIKRTKTQDGL